jgi:hypothetical protein
VWVEAILTREDLAKALNELCPLQIRLGKGGTLVVSEPHEVELVPDVGLHMTVTVEIHWPILGVAVPVRAREVALDVSPLIFKHQDGHEKLAFKLHLDRVDVALLPAFLDRSVVDRVNAELEAHHVELAWDFVETLSHVFPLPPELVSAKAVELKAPWGKVKTTDDTMVLAVSLHASILRREPSRPEGQTLAPLAAASDKSAPARAASTRLPRPMRAPFDAALLGGTLLCASLGIWALAHALRAP